MNSSKYIKLTLFVVSMILLTLLIVSRVSAYEEQCQWDCFLQNEDSIQQACADEHGDEFGSDCIDMLTDEFGTGTNYFEDCLADYGDEYAIDYNGDLFFMSVDEFIEEVCDEFDFACKEDMRDEYDDAPYDDIEAAEEACFEDHSSDFEDQCIEDFPEYIGSHCVVEYQDDYVDSCIDTYGTEEPSCSCEDDEFFSEDIGACITGDEFACYNDGGCKYDGDSYCSGMDGTNLDNPSSDCVSLEEGYCLSQGGIFVDDMCHDEDYIYTSGCEENGNYWSYMTMECYESEDEANCMDNGLYWSATLEECFDNEDEGTCLELDQSYVDGVCLSDEASQCYENGQVYCESMDSCVESEDVCCEDESHYVSELGECVDNEEQANCLNNQDYWSEDLSECFDNEEEAHCLENDYIWSETYGECFETNDQDAVDCINEGHYWVDDECKDSLTSYNCEENNLQTYTLASGEEICVTEEDANCRDDGGILFNGNCISNDYTNCVAQGMVYSKKNNECYRSETEKNCVENYKHPSYASPWVEYLHTCFAPDFQGDSWADQLECVGGDSFEEGAEIGIWNEELQKCFKGEDKFDANECESNGGVYNKNILPNDGKNCYSKEFNLAYRNCFNKHGTFTPSGQCVFFNKINYSVKPLFINKTLAEKKIFDTIKRKKGIIQSKDNGVVGEKEGSFSSNKLLTDCKYWEDIKKEHDSDNLNKNNYPGFVLNTTTASLKKLTLGKPKLVVTNTPLVKLSKQEFMNSYELLKTKCSEPKESKFKKNINYFEAKNDFKVNTEKDFKKKTNPQKINLSEKKGPKEEKKSKVNEVILSPQNQFYDLFFSNNKLNIFATRNDGVIEEYKIDLKEGIVDQGLYSKPNARIELTEEQLLNLLSSQSVLEDFFLAVQSNSVVYTLVESKGLFKSIGGFFSSIFSKKYDIAKVEDTVGSCLYLDSNDFNLVCKNDMLESECNKKVDATFYEGEKCKKIDDPLYIATKGIDWKLNKSEVLFQDSFKITNKSDLLGMFKTVMDARENGKVAQNIWDDFGIGDKIKDRINVDGSIDIGSFIDGNLAGGFGRGDSTDLGIGSNFGNKANRLGSDFGADRGGIDNPAGSLIPGGDGGFMGDGFGNDYGTGIDSGSNQGTGAGTGSDSGAYNGQMGGDSGYGVGGMGAGAMGAGSAAGGMGGAEPVWSVDATDSSYQHSGANGYSSFVHQHSTVSNDQGYSSTTDKQAFKGEDGTTITRVVVTQTDSDGNSKTSATTTKTDSDGNSESTQVVTEKNSDGEVTSQKVSNNPPKDDSDTGCQPATEEYNNPRTPPSNAEKQSAIGRALMNGGLAGGSPIGAGGATDYDVGDFNPETVGCSDDGCVQRNVGKQINKDKLNPGNIDTSGVNR